jgi:hypothetical protein
MKMKHVSTLAAVVIASLGVTSVQAIQKHDPIFQKAYAHSRTTDANLVRQVRYQNGSPRTKPDLYVATATSAVDPDLISGIRNQNGSPKSKVDQPSVFRR